MGRFFQRLCRHDERRRLCLAESVLDKESRSEALPPGGSGKVIHSERQAFPLIVAASRKDETYKSTQRTEPWVSLVDASLRAGICNLLPFAFFIYSLYVLRPTVLAIPFFALLIAGEALWHHLKGSGEYRDRKDTWNNIFMGFMSVVFGATFGLATGFIYIYAYEFAPFKFPPNAWWSWVILFFIDDLAYYIFHRVSHESRLFWNFHVVHHSSEQYNLSVAVRQSWFGGSVHWLFYAPIMLIGFAPWMFAITHGFNLIYQFWIHTKVIDKFPAWFEFLFNTPSHHRVHHGVNEKYLDKNYSGVLMIWDRMFGSFEKETEEPRYGIIKPLKSYNPLWVNTHAWFEMFAVIRSNKGIRSKLRSIFGSPNLESTN